MNDKIIREKIEDTLLAIGGCTPNLSGFGYLVDAVEIAIKQPNAVHAITKMIYPAVAERRKTTATTVDRTIRFLIEKVYLNADPETLGSILGNIAEINTGKTSNSAFIATLALKVRRELWKS